MMGNNTDLIVSALRTLTDGGLDDIPSISEVQFRQRYLGIFASEEPEVDLTPWLDVAGNMYTPVNVIENGEVLFQVPALLKSPKTNSNRRPKDSVFEMMETLNLKNSVNPFLGKGFMENEIKRRVGSREIEDSEWLAWVAIFKRYGLLESELTIDTNSTELSYRESGPEDLFDQGFDEL